MAAAQELRVAIVGPSGVGKTCFFFALTSETFPSAEKLADPEVKDKVQRGTVYVKIDVDALPSPHTYQTRAIEGSSLQVELLVSVEDHPFSNSFDFSTVASTDVVIVMFSTVDAIGFGSVGDIVAKVKKGAQTAGRHSPTIGLIGNKTDLRDSPDATTPAWAFTTKDVALKKAKALGCAYAEVSVLNSQAQVTSAMEQIVHSHFNKKAGCFVM